MFPAPNTPQPHPVAANSPLPASPCSSMSNSGRSTWAWRDHALLDSAREAQPPVPVVRLGRYGRFTLWEANAPAR